MHVGINAADEAEHNTIADQLSQLIFTAPKTGASSTFVGGFEVMKTPYLGKNGHVALGVNDIKRAVAYFEMMGVAFNKESAKEKDGKLVAIYFQQEIGGFAYHLVQK